MKLNTKLIICNVILCFVISVIALTGLLYIINASRGEPVVLSGKAVTGVRQAISNAAISTDPIEDVLSKTEYELGKYGFNYFYYNEDGTLVSTNSDSKTERKLADSRYNTSYEQSMIMDSNVIMFSLGLEGGWLVAVCSSGSRADLLQTLLYVYICSVVVGSVLMVLGVTFSEQLMIFPRLTALKQSMHQVYCGNYEKLVEVDTTKRDELSQVMAEFEMLRRKLNDSDKEKEAFDRERGVMISGISHDLRTPLSVIQGYAKGIKDGVARRIGKEPEYIDKIYSTALSMNALIDKLSAFAKMQSREVLYTFVEHDICDIVSEYVRKNYMQYSARGIRINAVVPTGRRIIVSLDKEQFCRVLQNVCDNSLKYKDKAVANLVIKVTEEDDDAVIELSDDGPGINGFEVDYIFESYYRGDQSRTNPVSGSGLGLSIVKSVVTAHKGTVCAYNNNGLTIKINIPIRRRK